MHLAAESRGINLELLKYFLEAGVDMNWANCDGETPLSIALRSKKMDVVRFLRDNLQFNDLFRPKRINYVLDNDRPFLSYRTEELVLSPLEVKEVLDA